jgi:hypothetical protein
VFALCAPSVALCELGGAIGDDVAGALEMGALRGALAGAGYDAEPGELDGAYPPPPPLLLGAPLEPPPDAAAAAAACWAAVD